MPVIRSAVLTVALIIVAGCGEGDGSPATAPQPTSTPVADAPAGSPAVPDGGTSRGHDIARPRVRVPENDATPPVPTVLLLGQSAGSGSGASHVRLPRGTRRVQSTVMGVDRDGGMGRVRVAFRTVSRCRTGTGEIVSRPFIHYVPRPQIARVKITPGTRVLTRLVRRAGITLDDTRCAGGKLLSVHGETWADVTNASGLDATSAHITFSGRP